METSVYHALLQHTGIQQPKTASLVILDKIITKKPKNVNVQRVNFSQEVHVSTASIQNILTTTLDSAKVVQRNKYMICLLKNAQDAQSKDQNLKMINVFHVNKTLIGM